jgi:two-component system NtrC family sensor kinase
MEPAQSEKMAAFETLIGGIAHDINNPLAGVLAFTQIAMQSVASGSQTHEDLKEIETSALRCKKILEDLVEMARTKMPSERSPTDLSSLLKKVSLELQARQRGLEERLDLQLNPLPPVSVSAKAMEKVFGNLLINAFQSLKSGGNIRVEARETEDSVEIEIQDEGEGISEENLKRIFDPYFTTWRQKGGHGLGLTVCYNIVRDHGGRIEVSSRLGEGSVFKLVLPKGGKE